MYPPDPQSKPCQAPGQGWPAMHSRRQSERQQPCSIDLVGLQGWAQISGLRSLEGSSFSEKAGRAEHTRHIYIYIYVYTHIHVHICVYVCMHVCIYACVCIYVCMHVCMHACMCACMCACMHSCMYVCMYVCTYVCMYVCIFIHMQ